MNAYVRALLLNLFISSIGIMTCVMIAWVIELNMRSITDLIYSIYYRGLIILIIVFGTFTLLNPFSRIGLPIAHIGGIFVRSVFIGLITAYYLEKENKYEGLLFIPSFYAFHEVLINTPLLLFIQPLTIIVREITTVLMLVLIFYLKILKLKITWQLVLTLGYITFLYLTNPIEFFLGEGYVPFDFYHQTIEFLFQPISIIAYLSLRAE